MKTARLLLPPIGNDDQIPHDKAVWREGNPPLGDNSRPVCAEYEGGIVARTYVGSVPDWARVVRWRRFVEPPLPGEAAATSQRQAAGTCACTR